MIYRGSAIELLEADVERANQVAIYLHDFAVQCSR